MNKTQQTTAENYPSRKRIITWYADNLPLIRICFLIRIAKMQPHINPLIRHKSFPGTTQARTVKPNLYTQKIPGYASQFLQPTSSINNTDHVRSYNEFNYAKQIYLVTIVPITCSKIKTDSKVRCITHSQKIIHANHRQLHDAQLIQDNSSVNLLEKTSNIDTGSRYYPAYSSMTDLRLMKLPRISSTITKSNVTKGNALQKQTIGNINLKNTKAATSPPFPKSANIIENSVLPFRRLISYRYGWKFKEIYKTNNPDILINLQD